MPSAKTPSTVWDPSSRPDKSTYQRWLKEVHSVDLVAEKTRFIAATAIAQQNARTASLWTEFEAQRRDLEAAYLADTEYSLFAFEKDKPPEKKTWDSFLDKTFRHNVLGNSTWPLAPESGWLLPSDWLVSVHDVIRTVVVVKYLDGVKFLIESLRDLAASNDIIFASDFQARDTGYYAAHTYSQFDASVPAPGGRTAETLSFTLELQVTTQLQEVMTRLTHKQYEARRSRSHAPDEKWQWDHTSPEFQPNYLGHILHYAEGMIMEVRDRDKN